MYEGCPAELQMRKTISADAVFDDGLYRCAVYKYDMEEDYIFLRLKEDGIETISLDAKYQCCISTKTEQILCTGVVKERFQSEDGNILVFRIENGFYSVAENKKEKL